jgi:hypothetical protein
MGRRRKKRPPASPPATIAVEFVLDADAAPGDVEEALAELLWRRAKAVVAEQLAAEKAGQGAGNQFPVPPATADGNPKEESHGGK